MQAPKRYPHFIRNGISYLSVDDIYPSPVQPRRRFPQESLRDLSESIAQYGVLNPLTVRRRNGRYELIAGERRLRASRLAGLQEVPCIVIDANLEEASLLALVENIQRRDLDFIEEAEGISQLIRLFGMSQGEAASRLGKSQPAIANKLRLLRLPSDVLDILRENDMTERHGRALLRLPGEDAQRRAARKMAEARMNVAAAEEYVEAQLRTPEPPAEKEPPAGGRKVLFVLKDVRVFLNTLTHGLDMMKQGGIEAGFQKHETDTELVLTISIPKQK
ncbi:MAG: ParB/RepB/Spo0J family partition protein [Oscillospiraceae bacterium]|jgi:ParB family chromosome partitioning protein|nr:ParB/RepB/Spo0J family partition protein [Oscillospiraceae bacterium]